MAAIDPQSVIDNTSLYIPSGNVLTNEQMLILVNNIISQLEVDDTEFQPQVQCDFLRALSYTNQARVSVDVGGIQSERVGDHARSYNSAYVNEAWKNFRDSLKDICPLFGYTPPFTAGIKINAGEVNDPLRDCIDPSTLSF